MLLWMLLALSAVLLITNWLIMGRLAKHRIGVPPQESILDGRNGLGSIDLWHASGYGREGQRLVRWWLLTLVGWFLALLGALFSYVLRGA